MDFPLMKINCFYLLCWLNLALGGCAQKVSVAPPGAHTVEIQRVISGQTIEWLDRDLNPPVLQIGKLVGIEAPDLRQEPWGKAAQQKLEQITRDRGNTLEVVELTPTADRYGRKLVELWDRGTSINETLIREGLVLPNYRATSVDASILDRSIAASQYARLMGYGIWNYDRPLRVSPSEFRREH
jgi:micrococcal nuclease